ncbi:uncharacterized protein LAESUDRAFT_484470 [Laetiporus sulphureus 93-53]|uniref:Uncharacterized protein n=1 Tax=Laetiporus sulphureus 93-53 TaxID=1314785 RepID=A0A165BPE4_9APHY|nr:uncharacterized protein LAESUDRAFT_484470 [Laetiporus sulphureus 93-53]KZT01416.1 hypothetical protein LAESUDRAFT_484470 [Laetiporus sulphureus 93-53]
MLACWLSTIAVGRWISAVLCRGRRSIANYRECEIAMRTYEGWVVSSFDALRDVDGHQRQSAVQPHGLTLNGASRINNSPVSLGCTGWFEAPCRVLLDPPCPVIYKPFPSPGSRWKERRYLWLESGDGGDLTIEGDLAADGRWRKGGAAEPWISRAAMRIYVLERI